MFMEKTALKFSARVNIMLPADTMRLLKRVAPKGDRSRLISEAVHFYVQEIGRARLREQLREGATHRAERNLKFAEEWFPLEEEAWKRGSGR
ncbi:MAG: hypothetical protein AAB533_03870 [Patescibacteria group bacterium]